MPEKDNGRVSGAHKAAMDVVIVNYNSTTPLLTCLDSVYTVLGPDTRVLVVDNASQDGVSRLAEAFPQAELSCNLRNLGFAAGSNQGLAKCRAPYVMLLNPDTVLEAGGWAETIDYLERHPEVGVLGPRILDSDGAVQGSARSFHSFHTAFFGRQALLTKWFPDNPLSRRNVLTHAQDDAPREVDWVSGACLLARKEAVERVGVLDERFFLYFEDTDWCRRMWLAGWRVVYWPRATVVHQIAASGGKRDLRPLWEFHKSCHRYLGKYALADKPWLRLAAAGLIGARFCVLALVRLGRKLLARARGTLS